MTQLGNVYQTLDTAFERFVRSSKTTELGGHFCPVSMRKIIRRIGRHLQEEFKETWRTQTIFDAGMGEGYFLYSVELQKPSQAIGFEIKPDVLLHSFSIYTTLGKVQNLTWCCGDLFDLTPHDKILQGVTIFYSFNFVFETDLTLHLIDIIDLSPSIHTVIMSKRALRRALESVLKPSPYERVFISKQEKARYIRWHHHLQTQQEKKRNTFSVRMAGSNEKSQLIILTNPNRATERNVVPLETMYNLMLLQMLIPFGRSLMKIINNQLI